MKTVRNKRQAMLLRCHELENECLKNGVKPGATTSYMKARFGVEKAELLSDSSLLAYGLYLKQIAIDSRCLKNRSDK